MTSIYFVRHAQPIHSWKNDMTRPLTDEGLADTAKVVEALQNAGITYAVSSPYERAINTIKPFTTQQNLTIHTDIRFRERESGDGGNYQDLFQKRWADFNFHEPGGESLHTVQARNIEALQELLTLQSEQKIVLGTHGTAMSTIFNYYDHSWNIDSFFTILDMMPCIFRMDFNGTSYLGRTEIMKIHKQFNGPRF